MFKKVHLEKLIKLKELVISWYTGPAKEKVYAATVLAAIGMVSIGGVSIYHLASSKDLHQEVYAVSESQMTTLPAETSSTDAPMETTTADETTTVEETTVTVETTTVEETTVIVETGNQTVIPVSSLDIASEDSLPDTDVTTTRQANQTTSVPAPKSPLQDISSSNTFGKSAGFITGIDVSKHQGSINWSQVKNDGISFAFIKIAGRGYETGKLYYDTRYKENLSGANAAGIKTGAYFFSQATTVQEAREEASMIIDALKGYKISYPVVFDWETAKGYRTYSGISKSTMTAMAETFCSMVEAAGYKAMIYANTFDFERFNSTSLTSRYASWLARYPENYDGNGKRFALGDGIPSLDYPYQIWQYSSTGRVSGISGYVDMNVGFIGFSGTSSPSVPITFQVPADEYTIKQGDSINLLQNVSVYNCAGILSTDKMQYSITSADGSAVMAEQTCAKSGKYTVTYRLKDFTGYQASKSIPFYVQTQPEIQLSSRTLVTSEDQTYEELLDLIKDNLLAATDFTGSNLLSQVSINYPENCYKKTEKESESLPETTTAAATETTTSETTREETSVPGVETTTAETTTEESTTPEETTTAVKEPEYYNKLIPGSYTASYTVTDTFGLTSSVSISIEIQKSSHS